MLLLIRSHKVFNENFKSPFDVLYAYSNLIHPVCLEKKLLFVWHHVEDPKLPTLPEMISTKSIKSAMKTAGDEL